MDISGAIAGLFLCTIIFLAAYGAVFIATSAIGVRDCELIHKTDCSWVISPTPPETE